MQTILEPGEHGGHRLHSWGETAILHQVRAEFINVETRLLRLRAGESTSYHAHQVRWELQIPIYGIVAVVGDGAQVIELPGGLVGYLIPPGVFHQFIAADDGPGLPGLVLSITFGRIDNDRL